MTIIKPIINLNGMSAEQHIQLRINARAAILDLQKALSELRPHGRDYIGEHYRYETDLKIWSERYAALDKLYNDLMDEAYHILES